MCTEGRHENTDTQLLLSSLKKIEETCPRGPCNLNLQWRIKGVCVCQGLNPELFGRQFENSHGPVFSRTLNPPFKNSWIRPCIMWGLYM